MARHTACYEAYKMDSPFVLAVLFTAFVVGEFAEISRHPEQAASSSASSASDSRIKEKANRLRKPLEEPSGEPLFLTPYIKKKDYQTGIALLITDVLLNWLVISLGTTT